MVLIECWVRTYRVLLKSFSYASKSRFTNGTTQNGLAIKNFKINPKLGLKICNRKPHLSDTLFEMIRYEKNNSTICKNVRQPSQKMAAHQS